MIRVSIVGGAGFAGGELLRLLLGHPRVQVQQVTSRRRAGTPLSRVHPHLRGQTGLRFVGPDALDPCDLLVLALPHGEASAGWDPLSALAPRVVDLSADFRLRDLDRYRAFYGEHPRPDLLPGFVYGLAEVTREELRGARRVATAGCNATVTILALLPLYEAGLIAPDRTVVEVKVGSSEGGARGSEGSHHPVRSGVVRPYRPTGHRHTAEIEEVLGRVTPSGAGPVRVHLSLTAVEMVRGASALAHTFVHPGVTERDIWAAYRARYAAEPFVRVVAERSGLHRVPEPRHLAGTNHCEVGFELDAAGERLVVMGALDNLVKGAAGQAVQAMNLMLGWEETEGLGFSGLFPL